jgi:hypothetical protein
MTTSIRYVQNTTPAANVNTSVASTGGDYQLVAFDITIGAGIAANANANILTWTGSGKIKSILAFTPRVAATGELLPLGIVAQNTHTLITIDASQKILNVIVPAAGVAIPVNTVISLLLVIGNY